jgi:hypothetical protein
MGHIMSEMEIDTGTPASRRKLIFGVAAAFVTAAVILLVFVLPAEFGRDPSGLGRLLGLGVLLEEPINEEFERGKKRTGVLAALPEEGLVQLADRYTIELGPFESTEFKYTLKQGEKMRFAWQASGPVDYDMHSHPFEGGVDLTESYAIEKAREQSGVYTAQFTGIHGWYWQNRTTDNVTLTLQAAGPMSSSTVFDQLGEHPRDLVAPEGGPEGN